MKSLRLFALLVCVLVPAVSGAQESRSVLIRKIAEAQGLVQLFDEQLVQQREATREYGKQIFEKMVSESGGGKETPKAKETFDRFISRTSTLFTSQEYFSVWAKAYDESPLTTEDLQAILGYYQSAVGKRDGAASQAAMKVFTNWFIEQNQSRSSEVLDRLAADLRDALP